jgi:hypothetical protein
MTFMMFLDSNDNIVQWASESITIPYRNPITGKQSMYVPDFFVTYRGRDNTTRAELIEIKPKKQSLIESQNERQRSCHSSSELRQMGCSYQMGTAQRTHIPCDQRRPNIPSRQQTDR